MDDALYWGHSSVLDLDLCWEYGWLRWYDPVAQRYLPTYDEAEDARAAAEDARAAAEARVGELEAQLERLRDP